MHENKCNFCQKTLKKFQKLKLDDRQLVLLKLPLVYFFISSIILCHECVIKEKIKNEIWFKFQI